MRVTDKQVETYLIDSLGYDEMIVDELKVDYKPLSSCLSDEELEDCVNYNM